MKKKTHGRFVVATLIVLAILLIFAWAATRKITGIQYTGLQNCTQEQIEKLLFQTKMERNPFVFWFREHFKEPVEIPFVEEYTVKMNSMQEITINVYEKSIIGCLKYMGEYMYFDKDGIVVEVTTSELDGIVEVTGIGFDHIVWNEKIPVEDEETFRTILDITQLLVNYGLKIDSMKIDSDLNTTLSFGNVKVELGENDDTMSGKISDLASIVPQMEDTPGVLDMTEYSTNDKRYTFKKQKG